MSLRPLPSGGLSPLNASTAGTARCAIALAVVISSDRWDVLSAISRPEGRNEGAEMKARLFMATLTAVLTACSGDAWALGNANTDRELRVWGKLQSENWQPPRCPVSNQWLNGVRGGKWDTLATSLDNGAIGRNAWRQVQLHYGGYESYRREHAVQHPGVAPLPDRTRKPVVDPQDQRQGAYCIKQALWEYRQGLSRAASTLDRGLQILDYSLSQGGADFGFARQFLDEDSYRGLSVKALRYVANRSSHTLMIFLGYYGEALWLLKDSGWRPEVLNGRLGKMYALAATYVRRALDDGPDPGYLSDSGTHPVASGYNYAVDKMKDYGHQQFLTAVGLAGIAKATGLPSTDPIVEAAGENIRAGMDHYISGNPNQPAYDDDRRDWGAFREATHTDSDGTKSPGIDAGYSMISLENALRFFYHFRDGHYYDDSRTHELLGRRIDGSIGTFVEARVLWSGKYAGWINPARSTRVCGTSLSQEGNIKPPNYDAVVYTYLMRGAAEDPVYMDKAAAVATYGHHRMPTTFDDKPIGVRLCDDPRTPELDGTTSADSEAPTKANQGLVGSVVQGLSGKGAVVVLVIALVLGLFAYRLRPRPAGDR